MVINFNDQLLGDWLGWAHLAEWNENLDFAEFLVIIILGCEMTINASFFHNYKSNKSLI
jgi:hypothetical protein